MQGSLVARAYNQASLLGPNRLALVEAQCRLRLSTLLFVPSPVLPEFSTSITISSARQHLILSSLPSINVRLPKA